MNPCEECDYKGQECDRKSLKPFCVKYARYFSYQECLKELASKCGPEPCEDCDEVHGNNYRKSCLATTPCLKAIQWLGQQQGYAKGLLEAESQKGEMAREIVEWLKADKSSPTPTWTLPERLKYYCRSKGWLKEGKCN